MKGLFPILAFSRIRRNRMPSLVVWASCVIVIALALLALMVQASIIATLNNDVFLPPTFRSGGETGFGMFIIAVAIRGFVIIGNCFYLTAVNDIRYLGRLRAVGMTGRQGARLLFTQAIILFLLALPVGVLLAAPLGNRLIPLILTLLNTAAENHEIAGLIEWPPKSIAMAAAFTLAAGMDSASFGQYALGGWDYRLEDMARYSGDMDEANEKDAALTRSLMDEIRAIDGVATVAALESAPVMMRYEEAFEKDMIAYEHGLTTYVEEMAGYGDDPEAFGPTTDTGEARFEREEFLESQIICADEALLSTSAAESDERIDLSAYGSDSYYLSALTPANYGEVHSVRILVNGEEKDFPVRGVIPSSVLKMEGIMPFLVTNPGNINISGLEYYLMEDAYIKLQTGASETEVRSQLAALLGHNERIRVTSRADMERSMGGAREMFHIIGGFVAGAVLLITHDERYAAYADRRLTLEDGRFV
jgi:hypothetical protein